MLKFTVSTRHQPPSTQPPQSTAWLRRVPPVLAQGSLVVAIVSQPFKFEGRRRMACARIAASALRREVWMSVVQLPY